MPQPTLLPIPALIAALLAAPPLLARAADEPPAPTVILIKGQGLAKADEAVSTTRLDDAQIREQRVARVQELFALVPGMDNRGLQIAGVADSVTLRGFTGGGHGGDLGAVIDGVPLNEPTSHADGYVDFNVIVPLELGQMTVYRGPVSALYGNYARAGVVAMESRKGGNYRAFDVSAGSFGTLDVQAAYGLQTEGRRINLAAQGWRTDGARAHSDWQRGTLAGRVAFDLSPNIELALSGRLHSGRWNATARITQAELDDPDRTWEAHPQAQNDGGDKHYGSLRADLGVSLGEGLRWLVFAYGVDQGFLRFSSFAPGSYPEPRDQPWPQRKEDYERSVTGFGTSLNGSQRLAGSPLNWVAGVEHYRDDTESRYRAALVNRQDTPATTDGTQRLSNREMRVDTTAVFAQAEWARQPWLRPSLGLRHDRFSGQCKALGTEILAGGCGAMNHYNHTSPKLALRSTVFSGLDLRASWAKGFQLPNDAAKFVEGGRVDPAVFRQTEIGATARLGAIGRLDLAWFRIDSRGEIVLTDAATATYANLGQTRRDGVEVDLRLQPTPQWEFKLAGAGFDSEVRVTSTPAALGRRVPNAARHLLTLGARWWPTEAWTLGLNLRKVGPYAVDAANRYVYPGHTVADASLEYAFGGRVAQRHRVYLRLDNLADKRYGASAGVTNGAWFYAPGASRSLQLGAQFSF